MRAFRIAGVVSIVLLGVLFSRGFALGAVVHEQEGSFPLTGFSFLDVDNSSGPDSGKLYIGEFSLEGFSSRVYQTDAAGSPTGVELDGSKTPAGSFGFFSFATFSLASGPAVDSSSGSNAGYIYVPDNLNGVVDLFDEAGEYVCQITGLVAPSATECAGGVGSATPSGTLQPLSVAVSPLDGRLAVGDVSGVVYLFNEAGEYIGQIADSHIVSPQSLAFDSTGALYVVNARLPNPEGSTAVKFNAAGGFEYELAPVAVGVGVDLANDHPYLVQFTSEGHIEEFNSSGSRVSVFGGQSQSIDVNRETQQVYVSSSDQGQIWSAPIVVPEVTSGPATEVGEGSATLNGEAAPDLANGGDDIAACELEYGETEAYGQTIGCSPSPPYSTATAVSAGITGLKPATTYHYRLAVEDSKGISAHGADQTFTTFGPPGITGEFAIARTRSATVKADIDPFGYATTCEVQYVDDASFQVGGYAGAASAPCAWVLPAGFGPQSVSAVLSGLQIGTLYHYRFVGTNQRGSSVGDDATFSTFGIESFSLAILDEQGAPFTQAGGHPHEIKVILDLSTTEALTTRNPKSVPANVKTVKVELPPGLIGNPTAAVRCPSADVKPKKCAGATQVGFATVTAARGASEFGPVYNVVPPKGVAAQLAARFNAFGMARIDAGVRTGSDYGVTSDSLFVTADEGVERIEISLWGVPADEKHLNERFCADEILPGCPSNAPLRPFLTTPTSCLGPLQTVLSVDAWQDPGVFDVADSWLPGMSGCERVQFNPTLEIQPDTKVSDSPSGLHVDLHVPQNQNPVGLAEANLKDAVVRLPAGVVLNPAGAKGLVGCSPEQVDLHGPGPAACPDASKVGTAKIHTPLLDHPVEGAVYVAQQGNAGAARGANPFGSLLAIYIALHDPESGVVVKLAGQVAIDPQGGQLTTTFRENPQLPFEHFELDFFSGQNAALSTPITCGSFTSTSDLTPWTSPAGADAHPQSSFEMNAGPGRGCVGSEGEQPNAPKFEAGTVSPLAGAYSPLVLNLSRADGTQRFSSIDTTLPKGLLGKLKGIPYCSESAIAQAKARSGPGDGSLEQSSPSCPGASQLGSVQVGAGTGSNPLVVKGSAYLAGPYKGAPLSLVIVTPAVAGPFDLGAVVVRTALYVEPENVQIRAKSDPFPTMLEGIPLNLRTISLQMDRPNFTLNPTSCDPTAVTGALTSTTGSIAPLKDRFQVGGCGGLRFAPKLSLRVLGKTGRNAKPRLRAVLTAKPGEANIARAQVNLPHSEFLEQAHIRTVCTRVQFAQGNVPGEKCPAGSIYGKARAWSPLLDGRLEGPVFLRSSSNKLPDLVATLNGQVNIVLAGKIDTGRNKGLRNTFEVVPDAPVSKFVLEMKGGKRGLLVNSENLCSPKADTRAIVRFTGHNGKVHQLKPKVKNSCGKKRPGKKR
jgi:hypothetical protein